MKSPLNRLIRGAFLEWTLQLANPILRDVIDYYETIEVVTI
jgi:hypothetical protein